MHICVVTGIQRDTTNGSTAREKQVCLWRRVTSLLISFQLDASGAGTGESSGVRQAKVRAATITNSTFIKALGSRESTVLGSMCLQETEA